MALQSIHLDGPQVDSALTAIAKASANFQEISQRLLLLERTGFQPGLYDPDPSTPAYSFSSKGSPWTTVTKRTMLAGVTAFDQVNPVGDGKFVTASPSGTAAMRLYSTAPDGTITKIAEQSTGTVASVAGVVPTSPTTFKVLGFAGSVYDMFLDGSALTTSVAASNSNNYLTIASSNKRARLAHGKIAVPVVSGLGGATTGSALGFIAAAQGQTAGHLGGGAFARADYSGHGFTHDYLTPSRTIAAWRDSSGSSPQMTVGVFECDGSTNGRVLDQVVIEAAATFSAIYVYAFSPTLAVVSYSNPSSRRMQVLNISSSTGRITALGPLVVSGAGAITPRVAKPQDAKNLFVCQQSGDLALSSMISVDTATGALTKTDIPNSYFGSSGAGTITDISKLGPDRIIVSGRDGNTGSNFGLQVWDMS